MTRMEYDGIKIDFAPVSKTYLAPEQNIHYNNSIDKYSDNGSFTIKEEELDIEELRLSDPLAYEEYISEGN